MESLHFFLLWAYHLPRFFLKLLFDLWWLSFLYEKKSMGFANLHLSKCPYWIILFFYQTRFLLLFFFNKYFLSRAANIAVHFLGITHKWYSSEHPVTLGSELQMSWFQKVLTSKSKIGFHLGDFNIILFCSISCTRTVLHKNYTEQGIT